MGADMKRTRNPKDVELGVDLQRAGLAMALAGFRKESGLAQSELAELASISQQQLSKLEQGDNCHIATFLKVCEAMELELKCVRRSESGSRPFGRTGKGGS